MSLIACIGDGIDKYPRAYANTVGADLCHGEQECDRAMRIALRECFLERMTRW